MNKEDLLLTDEEMARAAYRYNELYKGGVFEYTRKPDADKAIAQAQLDKIILLYEQERCCQEVMELKI